MQAVLRRDRTNTLINTQMLRVGPFQIDLDRHEASVICNGQQEALDLTLTEFKIRASMQNLAL